MPYQCERHHARGLEDRCPHCVADEAGFADVPLGTAGGPSGGAAAAAMEAKPLRAILEKDERGLKQRYIGLLESLPRKTPGPIFVPAGQKSQGGCAQCEATFDKMIEGCIQRPPHGHDEAVEQGVDMAKKILQLHVFRDGNGRAAIFTLYFHLANYGFKLTARVINLHSYLLSEDAHDSIPAGTPHLLRALSHPETTHSVLRNHIDRVIARLITLEQDRDELIAAGRHYQRGDVMPKAGRFGTWRAFKEARAGGVQLASLTQKMTTRATDLERAFSRRYLADLSVTEARRRELATYWVGCIIREIGHMPSSDEVERWIAWNWPD